MWNHLKLAAERLALLTGTKKQTARERVRISLFARDIGVTKFLVILVQLGLVLLLVREFRIEVFTGLPKITAIIFGGFVVHTWLARRFRLPFFLLLSMLAIEAVFGAVHALWLIGIGLGLIGLCHLPIPFAWRVGLVAVSGGGLAALQAGWWETSWSGVILPILASMFMFRIIIYLYDLRHERTPATIWERLSYFFLLPNVCFPLFPVVDYRMFRRTYYDGEPGEIYQNGVLWIFRGITHLLLYRIIYFYFTPSPAEVQGLSGVVLYVVSSYLLYLRISGLFHMIIGILCLFGFNLPETHHLYFLASGFNDVWRRLNIYWKDFMVKIFYYPVLMRVRRWGMTPARVVATMVVFLVTWLLHSYQWFWLQGAFPVTAVDGLYWGLLGGLVIINTLAVTGTTQTSPEEEETNWSWPQAATYSLKVLGMFVVMSVLWSFWSSSSITEWVAVMKTAGSSGIGAYSLLLAGLATLVGAGVLVQYAAWHGWGRPWTASDSSFAQSALYTGGVAVLILGVTSPALHVQMSEEVSAVVVAIQEPGLNQRDLQRMERGYYEGLLAADNNYTSRLWWSAQAKKPKDWDGNISESEAAQEVKDIRDYQLKPESEIIFKRAEFRTNRWGMRDKHYPREKPPDTYRIALMGASYIMGAGVSNDHTFEAVVEDRLNNESHPQRFSRYELLNWATGGYALLDQLKVLSAKKIFSFNPDAVFYFVHPVELQRITAQLVKPIQRKVSLESAYVRKIIRQAGVTADMPAVEIRRRLSPFATDIATWGYRTFADECTQHGAVPVLVFLPETDQRFDKREVENLSRLTREAGFVTLSLQGAYDNYEAASIQLAPWDHHLNQKGHQLVADRLYRKLQEHKHALGMVPEELANEHNSTTEHKHNREDQWRNQD